MTGIEKRPVHGKMAEEIVGWLALALRLFLLEHSVGANDV